MVNVLVCVKRVPGSSGRILLTPDSMGVDTRHVGWTTSPHEECAVEAAVSAVEEHGGAAAVLTLGPEDAVDTLREALAVGVTSAVHVVTADDAAEGYGPADVAQAVASVVRDRAAAGDPVDLVLMGNDAADTGDFQVGIRTAYLLGVPVVTGVRSFTLVPGDAGGLVARATGDGPDGVEEFEVPLPAVLTVKEGEISPRYPSIPGRLKAKRAPVTQVQAAAPEQGTARRTLLLPPEAPSAVEVIGHGADAAPALVDLLEKIGVVTK